jgi:hypothetical protein
LFTIEASGNTDKSERFLNYLMKGNLYKNLNRFGKMGVAALAASTPAESGLTAASWNYEVEITATGCTISWTNGNLVGGVPLAILLQYGHGTGTGGYVAGRDYINPAIKPVFDQIAQGVWKQVTSA